MSGSQILDHIVRQHIQQLADCYHLRNTWVSPLTTLSDMVRADDRLAAHVDGLATAGSDGLTLTDTELAGQLSVRTFVVAVIAISQKESGTLDTVVHAARTMADAKRGLLFALGWLDRDRLQGIVASLLTASDACDRAIGIAACANHRVDPRLDSAAWLRDPAPVVRARVLRAIGELGRHDLAPRCTAAITDEDPECQFWAAWSGLLLGNRGVALDALARTALTPGAPHRSRALGLTLQAMDLPLAHSALQILAKDPAQLRWLIHGSGIAGDPAYAPWLIGHMAMPETARLAGEAFTLITRADLDKLQLYRAQPEDFESGPNEDPTDPNVDMDPDDGLPWPDPERIKSWWATNGVRFEPGTRYFMGAPVTREHCIDVLKNGYQRQRILAAHYLCLLEPGTPLFNTSAPAWRQQKLLAQMG